VHHVYAILCPCCERLVEAIASGKQSKAIVGAIEAKEAEAEALKVKGSPTVVRWRAVTRQPSGRSCDG